MKKEFVEPAMRRIELNLRENIAASGGDGEQSTTEIGITFMFEAWVCVVMDTGLYPDQVTIAQVKQTACYNTKAKIAGKTVPLEEARKYFRG